MQKSILTASLFGWCLSTLGAAYAAPSPVPLLVEQCLRQPNIDLAGAFASYASTHQLSALTLADKALVLEQQTIGLNNVNDRLTYYRGLPLSGDERQGILQCQLRLADTLSDLLNQAEFSQLAFELTQTASENDDAASQEQALLGKQLTALLRQHLSIMDKAKLHTAQASIRQGLGNQQFQLDIQADKCQLTDEVAEVNTANNEEETANSGTFSGTIASYLLKQPDAECRQTLWQAYQGRAREHNQVALHRIAELRQRIANDAGFSDYVSYSLKDQLLNTPELVKAFLDSQTETIQVAPWDLGRTLSQLPSAQTTAINTRELLDKALTSLSEYGLRFEVIGEHLDSAATQTTLSQTALAQAQQQILRVYHTDRLLGEVYLAIGAQDKENKSRDASQHTLRQNVIGQQFGQQALELPATLNNFKDIERFTQALADTMTSLARGSHFYLNNTLGPTLDTNQLPSLWLAKVLRQALFPQFDTQYIQPREMLASAYATQLKVFRAKVALNFYQSLNQQSYSDLPAEFSKSFGANWAQAIDYPYSFNAIANEGPRYYQSQWQAKLATLVHQSTQDCQDKLGLFNLLVVNETALTLSEQLRAILGDPVDAAALIQRIIHVSGSENHPHTTTETQTLAAHCAF
ncbi:M3 family metallopeptidase [Shewanella decolorationis]|uniref:Response regulator receiver protein n=1 Tax=Shewanella decolorationis S12 TaxID=1353536 RepID=A0ABN0PMI6_9GAMM|nr:M3 family metallopeptidase [Shewanella decolorationis]ESE41313.1 response regulator receiver protein [Shewanella decolorationis S12]GLR30457.1 Zn-dependent oligopeptidase [Shewanella decolorationis]